MKKLALLGAAIIASILMIAAPASQAAISGSHNIEQAVQLHHAPDAKRVGINAAATLCGGRTCRITARVWTDAGYRGVSNPLSAGDYGDCDGSGYVFTFKALSLQRGTSSISRSSTSPRCNTVGMTTTYGGTGVRCLSLPYVGDAFNDQIAKVRIYYTSGCH